MSTLVQIIDRIKSNLTGGITTDETRFEDALIESKIHNHRAAYLSAISRQPTRDRINDSFLQVYHVDLLEYDVECDVVKFICPTVIQLDDRNDGFFYVGHINGLKPFIRLRTNYPALSMHSLFKKEKEIVWDYRADYDGQWYINVYRNPRLTKLLVMALFNDPTAVPNYRKDVDQYPLDGVAEHEVVDAVSKDLLGKNIGIPDMISDSAEVNAPTRK